MVESKVLGDFDPFQKWYPLKIAHIADIPSAAEIKSFSSDFINSDLSTLKKYEFLNKLAVQMSYLCLSSKGVGLNAVQCGIPLCFFVAFDQENRFNAYLDAKYEGLGQKHKSIEGCLSLKDENNDIKRYILERYGEIRVFGKKLYEESLVDFDEKFNGFYSVVLQHEIDHNYGILISELGEEIKLV